MEGEAEEPGQGWCVDASEEASLCVSVGDVQSNAFWVKRRWQEGRYGAYR